MVPNMVPKMMSCSLWVRLDGFFDKMSKKTETTLMLIMMKGRFRDLRNVGRKERCGLLLRQCLE